MNYSKLNPTKLKNYLKGKLTDKLDKNKINSFISNKKNNINKIFTKTILSAPILIESIQNKSID